MVKKLQKMAQQKSASGARLLDSQLASAVKESAQQIWLAGMGAFSKAQAEGGKVFEALVKEGASLQRKTQSAAEDRIGEVAGRMTAMADGVTAAAGQKWDKLEAIFEDRVAKALGKLGVPSRKDIDVLIERIDALGAQVGKLGQAPKSPSARIAKPTVAAARRTAETAAAAAKPARKRPARKPAAT